MGCERGGFWFWCVVDSLPVEKVWVYALFQLISIVKLSGRESGHTTLLRQRPYAGGGAVSFVAAAVAADVLLLLPSAAAPSITISSSRASTT